MAYTDIGYDEFLTRTDDNPLPAYTQNQADFTVQELSGENIVNPEGESYLFNPTKQLSDPKEGEAYYDATTKKLRIFTGINFETINSG